MTCNCPADIDHHSPGVALAIGWCSISFRWNRSSECCGLALCSSLPTFGLDLSLDARHLLRFRAGEAFMEAEQIEPELNSGKSIHIAYTNNRTVYYKTLALYIFHIKSDIATRRTQNVKNNRNLRICCPIISPTKHSHAGVLHWAQSLCTPKLRASKSCKL